MAYQFGKPTYCISLVKAALLTHWEYECVIGKEELTKWVSFPEAEAIVEKYGEDKAIREINGKECFILPVDDLRDTQQINLEGLRND